MAIDFGEMLKGVFGGKKAETPPVVQPTQPAQPTPVDQQIATHQAAINESQNMLDQISMAPTPQDKPIIEAEQAKMAAAREALSNLQPPTPPTPETPPPGITQIPVANPEVQPIVNPTVAEPQEEQKAA